MGKTLYLDCGSGISGDMAVAAMLDLGADEKVLMEALHSLPVSGYEVKISRVSKSGIDACDFNVVLDEEHENHDHDMEYLHGHDHSHDAHDHNDFGHDDHHHDHDHGHDHGEDHHHGHEADHYHDHGHGEDHHHGHGHSHHHHEHRGLNEILGIISQGKMSDGAKKLASDIFTIIAQAEAKAHGLSQDQVHFHEVGAVDSIVDIVAFAVCFDNLDISRVIIPKLNEGVGTVRCQHGILPIPVPAVANIASAHHLPLHIMDVQGEFVTPTGAAIAAAIMTSQSLPETFAIIRVGLGAGKRHYDRPSFVRAMLIEDEERKDQDRIWKLETDIDDCSGENLGFVMDLLFEAGARDVHYMPVFMKKNRPAYELCVICSQNDLEKMEQIIFKHTTTIGIRRMLVERTILPRTVMDMSTSLGTVSVKVCQIGGERRFYPEYESVAAICRKENLPYSKVYQTIVRECEEKQS